MQSQIEASMGGGAKRRFSAMQSAIKDFLVLAWCKLLQTRRNGAKRLFELDEFLTIILKRKVNKTIE